MRLRNKVALITGAGSGIGAASARYMAEEGAAIALVGIPASVTIAERAVFAATVSARARWSERPITIYIPIRTVALSVPRRLFRWDASGRLRISLRGLPF